MSYEELKSNEEISKMISEMVDLEIQKRKESLRQRQAEGIAEAKKRGVKFGRPRKKLPENFDDLYKRFCNNESIASLAKDCEGISESTLRLRLYERLKEESQ